MFFKNLNKGACVLIKRDAKQEGVLSPVVIKRYGGEWIDKNKAILQ